MLMKEAAQSDPVQMMLLGEAAENAGAGVVVWNSDRRYVACNARCCELLGTTREALLRAPVGSTNRSGEAQALIDGIIERAPAAGTIHVGDRDLDWVAFPTTIAGLDHIVGLMWEAFGP